MTSRNTTRPLSTHPLTAREETEILGRMYALAEFMGSPGDWGYGTTLGDLTMQLHQVRAALMASRQNSAEGGDT